MTTPAQIIGRLRFRFAASLLLISAFALNAWAQSTDTEPRTVTLKRGRVLEMQLVKRLDSGRAKVGDDFALKLTKPLLADGVTVLPVGSVVHGRITDAKRAGKNCQRGFIDWELQSVTMTDGQKIEIESIAKDVTRRGILNRPPHDPGDPNAEGKAVETATRKSSSRVGSIVKDIAIVPLVIVALPILVLELLSEGYDSPCPGGKGREDSVRAGTPFYAEVSNDVQQIVE